MTEPSRAEFKYLIERQREELKTINEVGRLLSSTTDPQEIVRLVASYLKRTFPLALCGTLFLEPRRLQTIQYAKIAQGDLENALHEMCAKAAEYLRKPLTFEEFPNTIEDQSSSGPPGYLRSSYFAPLTFDSQVVGLLAVFSGKEEAFGKDDQHVLNIVADQLRAALRNAFLLDELRRANELKNELLMVISHELRIPLTSIKEGVGLILESALGPITDEQRDFLKTVNDNVERLGTLVEKVMLTTQLITGQLRLKLQPADFDALLKDLEASARTLARTKGVTLELTGARVQGSTRAVSIVADAKRLKQALGQLVENAIQATPAEGRVAIQWTDRLAGVEVEISDTGVGIPEEALPTLFAQFHIVGGVDNRKTGGLGLGLFIAKAVIEEHGGTIKLESKVGHGTRVMVQLPKEPPPKAEPVTTPASASRGPAASPGPSGARTA